MTSRFGFLSILGAPNAGKSTLVNALTGHKVAITCRKVQTTRIPVTGIVTCGGTQIAFIDTPGVFTPRRRLDRAMVRSAQLKAQEADVCALIVDASTRKGVEAGLELVEAFGSTFVLLNKNDRLKGDAALPVLERFAVATGAQLMVLSALRGQGVAEFLQAACALMPEGPWHYAPDMLTDQPMALLCAEITREQLMHRLHEEIPYHLTVVTDSMTMRKKRLVVHQTVCVQKASHRMIVLGRGGAAIKAIGQAARHAIAAVCDRPVDVFLHVAVKPDWENRADFYRAMSLEFDARP